MKVKPSEATKKIVRKKVKDGNKRLREHMGGQGLKMVIGCICALINGGIMPMFALFLADMIDSLTKYILILNGHSTTATWSEVNDEVNKIVLQFVGLGLISFLANMIQFSFFN